MDAGDPVAGPEWVGLARKLIAEQAPLQPGEIGQQLQPPRAWAQTARWAGSSQGPALVSQLSRLLTLKTKPELFVVHSEV